MDQILALIHFYLKEEPMLTREREQTMYVFNEGEGSKDKGLFDRIALLWGRVQFALQFEDKMRIKTIPKG